MSASGGKQTPKNRTYTVEDIAAILGIGKSSAYKLANSGEFQTIRIGNMIAFPENLLRIGWGWRRTRSKFSKFKGTTEYRPAICRGTP